MRQLSIFLLSLSLLLTSSFTQPSHSDSQDRLSKVDRLYYTCKIWGFLKYYHPLMGRGAYDWDQKLQDVLGRTADIQTYSGFSTYMNRWIYAMGARPQCTSCKKRSQYKPFRENFDLSWTQSNVFSAELRKAFKDIENNRFQGDHHYIGQGKGRQFEPKNEKPDYDFIWQDENQRLLPLFRYWNYIEYFSPYKYLTDQSWDDVLKEMIPKFLAAETKLDLHLAMLELIVKTDDGNAAFTTPLIEQMPLFNYLPVRFELIENQAVITEIIDRNKAELDDLQVGDIITRVNNQPVIDLHETHKKYIWGSNEAAKDRSISYTLFMGMKGAQLTIKRDGSEKTKDVTLYKRITDLNYTKENSQKKWTTLLDSISYEITSYDSLYNSIKTDSIGYVEIGYVDMGQLAVGDVDPMMSELLDKDAIIFDVRNNPRGTYGAIAKYLNPTATTFVRFTRPDLNYPGKFVWDGERTCGEENADYYKGKVILLVNADTQNHAEFTCMCLQTAPDVVTIGSQTAGANSNVSRLRILQRLQTSFSGIGVHYPDGRPVQRKGVITDMVVKPTIAGIRASRDEILEKAIEVVKKEVEEEEVARLKEIERLREIARLEEIARQLRLDSLRKDSLRLDSLRMDSLQMDSLQTDSLEIDEGGY